MDEDFSSSSEDENLPPLLAVIRGQDGTVAYAFTHAVDAADMFVLVLKRILSRYGLLENVVSFANFIPHDAAWRVGVLMEIKDGTSDNHGDAIEGFIRQTEYEIYLQQGMLVPVIVNRVNVEEGVAEPEVPVEQVVPVWKPLDDDL